MDYTAVSPALEIQVVTCDKCGAEETPDNMIEFHYTRGGVIDEGPPEWFTVCTRCTSKESEVPF